MTVDGVRHTVGRPFMVIATQNPIEQAGTYRLPEAQLDRFLMKSSIGYPDHDAVELMTQAANRDRSAQVHPVIAAHAVAQMSNFANEVHVEPAILGYISRLAEQSRGHGRVKLGLSMRGRSAACGPRRRGPSRRAAPSSSPTTSRTRRCR